MHELCNVMFTYFSQHETASVKMFEHLVTSNGLEEVMKSYGLVLEEDMIFIKEQIGGPIDENIREKSVSHCISTVVIPTNILHFTNRVDNFCFSYNLFSLFL